MPTHWRLLLDLALQHRRRFVALGAVLAGASALPLVGPLLLKAFVDRAVAGAPTADLVRIAAGYVVVAAASQVATVAVAYAGTGLAWTATNRLRADLARHALSLDLGFHRRTTAGELVERVDGDVTAVAEFLATFVIRVIGAALTLVGIVGIVLVHDWRIGLGVVGFVGVAALVLHRMREAAVLQSAAEREATAWVLGGIEERLDGLDDIRANGGGGHALARFEEQSGRLVRRAVRREAAVLRIYTAASGVFAAGGALALAGGALAHRAGWISLGTVFLLFQYVQQVRRPLEETTEQLQEVQRAAGGMHRVGRMLGERSRLAGGDRPLPPGPLGVELGDCEAHYGDGVAVLRGVSLEVPAGTSLALVGRTGAGKTTVARLLTRQLDPVLGRVRVGGVDLREARLDDLTARVGLVTQDVHLFGASVRDNVTVFDDRPSELEVAAALEDVGLGRWLEALPEGLDTPVGPGGTGMSAGEAQLLALARLFLRDPSVMVLDEASSRLDPDSEARVNDAVARLVAGRTALVIAHRTSTLEHVDAVAVLEDGSVVEHGPRPVLAADPSSRFARLLAAGLAEEPS